MSLGQEVNALDATHYLLEVQLLREKVPSFTQYPFSLPAVQYLEKLTLHPSVTFIIGENGTGKSTLLEAIAVAWGFNPEGGTRNFNFSTRTSHSTLHQYLRLVKNFRRPKDGFFLRAESFFNVATEIENLDKEPAFGPPIVNSYGGHSLHEQSHGESFFSLFIHRFGGKGFYILDEPEAALSPTRQLAMITRLHELVEDNSQFIIATHSPIIMAYPNAKIFQLSDQKVEEIEYEETEHYLVSKRFFTQREKFLRQIL